MDQSMQILRYFVIEPFVWLRDAFFPSRKPPALQVNEDSHQVLSVALRLILPLIITSYLFLLLARLTRIILSQSEIIYQYSSYTINEFFFLNTFIYVSTAIGVLFILIGDRRFGIIYGVGTSIALTLPSVFIHLYNPAQIDPSQSSYNLWGTLLTGFAIGTLFAITFATTETIPIYIVRGIMRGISFAFVLLIILHHLENASLQDLWSGVKMYGGSAGLIGCVAAGISLFIAGDIIFDARVNQEGVERMITRGVTGGIVFGIIFALILFSLSLFPFLDDLSSKETHDIENLNLVSISLGFVFSFWGSISNTFIRRLLFTIGIVTVLTLLVSNSSNAIVILPVLTTISTPTSPLFFIYSVLISFAFGVLGGCICSNENKYVLMLICSIALLLETLNYLIGGLTALFTTSLEVCMTLGVVGGIGTGLIAGYIRESFKLQNSVRATRCIAFCVAMVITSSIIPFASFNGNLDTSFTYTSLQTAIFLGGGCLVGCTFFIIFYDRVYFFLLNLLAIAALRMKTMADRWKVSFPRLITTIIIFIIAFVIYRVYSVEWGLLVAVIALIFQILPWLSDSNTPNR